jgi:hypothetical protein
LFGDVGRSLRCFCSGFGGVCAGGFSCFPCGLKSFVVPLVLAEACKALEFAVVAFQRPVGVEHELSDVGHGDGVEAIDALERHLAEKIAEEDVDRVRSREVVHVAKELAGIGFLLAAEAGEMLAGVVRAERIVQAGSEHATASATSVDVGALLARGGPGGGNFIRM